MTPLERAADKYLNKLADEYGTDDCAGAEWDFAAGALWLARRLLERCNSGGDIPCPWLVELVGEQEYEKLSGNPRA